MEKNTMNQALAINNRHDDQLRDLVIVTALASPSFLLGFSTSGEP